MLEYHNFFGVDIGKFEVFVAIHDSKSVMAFPNTKQGFSAFYKNFRKLLSKAFIVLETTGGYEQLFLHALLDKNVAVHRANTRQVKSFIRSYGKLGKSDCLDAQALARYGYERHVSLNLYQKPQPILQELAALAQRRQDLIHMLVQEKNRLKAPAIPVCITKSCSRLIKSLEAQIAAITNEMEEMVTHSAYLRQQRQILESIPGIGKISALMLLTLLPELGQLNRREIASLCGVAPHPYESGQKIGYRKTKGGRQQVRSILFMVAMAARRSNSKLKTFYESLISRGKKKMVALTALMRKIIVIANARMKEFLQNNCEHLKTQTT